MKKKMFTDCHSTEVLSQVDKGGQFTPEEHSYVSERELGEFFTTRAGLIAWYLNSDYFKLEAIGFLIGFLKKHEISSAVSFAAGACVLEHLLVQALPSEFRLISTEFDRFFVKKAQLFFPETNPCYFDFCKDRVITLMNTIRAKPTMGFSFGSFYVMDNDNFVSFLQDCRQAGLETIIDFHAGYMTLNEFYNNVKWGVGNGPKGRSRFCQE